MSENLKCFSDQVSVIVNSKFKSIACLYFFLVCFFDGFFEGEMRTTVVFS